LTGEPRAYYNEIEPYCVEWLRNLIDAAAGWPAADHSFWGVADWLRCRDGKWRPVESGTFPLAHGIPARVGKLRAWGNAIVPAVAVEVIRAYMDTE
jgi:DNA (cytosine-5)-methyltransferase 1